MSTLAALVPRRCLLCNAAGRHDTPLCIPCLTRMPLADNFMCSQCAAPTGAIGICGQCLIRPPAWDTAISAFHYAPPVSDFIRQLKYRGDLVIGQALGVALAQAVAALDRTQHPQAIVPVPLSTARLASRGFNQAAEIARTTAEILEIPHSFQLLNRHKDTRPQTDLKLSERHRNLRGAFRSQPDIAGMHVALIDDVLTSGATAQAAALACRKSGAVRVDIWVVARAVAR